MSQGPLLRWRFLAGKRTLVFKSEQTLERFPDPFVLWWDTCFQRNVNSRCAGWLVRCVFNLSSERIVILWTRAWHLHKLWREPTSMSRGDIVLPNSLGIVASDAQFPDARFHLSTRLLVALDPKCIQRPSHGGPSEVPRKAVHRQRTSALIATSWHLLWSAPWRHPSNL